MGIKLEKEFEFFKENQRVLVEKYPNKVIAIKNCVVVGTYDNELDAITNLDGIEEEGTYILQKCEPGTSAYTASYFSNVNHNWL
ncbi:MAG: hypothetical protein P9L94_03015 [Candidatus Hinthialibacter antarcticus]|nr:hypothetical protein [Candidatus Hinthialibacter antarcticus]